MKKKIIDIIVGARPNFMKAAALFALAKDFPTLKLRLVHTGQHYDSLMSEVFVQDLSLPAPVCCLEVGSGSHASQTAGIMKKYEQWVQSHRPDICMVVGDVNSTVACAIVAAKLGIKVLMGARDENRGNSASHKLKEEELDVAFIQLDVTNEQQIKNTCDRRHGTTRRRGR